MKIVQILSSLQGVVFLFLISSVSAFLSYRFAIPNGVNVLDPCDGNLWPGVGHLNPQGAGNLNPFGEDFRASGHSWTTELCLKDSDGDGLTNGYELGDRNCNWSTDNSSVHLDRVEGHPGVCEPLDDLVCETSWFTCVPPSDLSLAK